MLGQKYGKNRRSTSPLEGEVQRVNLCFAEEERQDKKELCFVYFVLLKFPLQTGVNLGGIYDLKL